MCVLIVNANMRGIICEIFNIISIQQIRQIDRPHRRPIIIITLVTSSVITIAVGVGFCYPV